MRVLILGFERRAIPPMPLELMLTLVNGDLDALYRRSSDVRVPCANLVLRACKTRIAFAHGVGVQGVFRGQLETEDVVVCQCSANKSENR